MTRSIAVQTQSRRRKSRSTATSTRAPRPTRATSRTAAVEVEVEVEVEAPMDIDGASESEYETDTDAEPEEFYISLDLTIPTPIHAGPSSNPHTNTAPPSTLPPPLPLSSTTRSGRSGRSGRRYLPNRPPSAMDDDDPAANGTVARWATGDSGRIQILDLHTENPLISFGNRIWSGSWMGTVGTELFIRCPEGPAPEDQEEVKGVYVSQKDTSAAAAAVVGTVVTGEDGSGLGLGDPDVGKVIAVSNTRVHCLPAVVTAKERPLVGPMGTDERTYGWRPGKSTFLEQLEAIRVAKGEREPREEGEDSSSSESESDEQQRGTAFQERVDGRFYDEDGEEYEMEYEFYDEEEEEELMEQEKRKEQEKEQEKGKGKGKEKAGTLRTGGRQGK